MRCSIHLTVNLFGLCFLVILPNTLLNFNHAAPGEYEDCHGFEVELEDLPCSNVYYTFSYNRYGAPDKSDTATGGCIVSYVSSYDSVNSQWLVTTPVPSSLLLGGKVTPTNGHSCFSSGQSDYATSGCEHFGVSLGGKNPTATKYRWLIANPAIPGTLMHASTKVGIPAVTWNVRPNAGVNGGNVVAAVIEAEPPEPVCGLCSKWGEPRWVKVFKTEIEYEVDLDHLLTDSDEVPQSSSETEMEWVLLQARPTCDNDWPCAEVPFNASENELALEEEANDASKTVIRRYEFYEYTGEVNPEDNEAQPSFTGDGCEADPASPDCDIVGNYLGAQMAAAVLGLGDVLDIATQSPVMAGQVGVNYLLMLTAVGGTGPYSWSLTAGTMFAGLGLTGDGWISGMPIESGTRTFEINLEDADGTIVAKNLTLTIVGPSSEPTVAPTSTPTNLSTPEPTYIPTSSPTQHPVVNPPPTQNP